MNSSKENDSDQAERAIGGIVMSSSTPIVFRGGTSPKYVKLCALNMLRLCFRKDPDEDQQFLDIGCGNGEFTGQELLHRCLPCRRIVAVDVARSTLDKAREKFSHPKIEYDFLDIGKDISGFLGQYGQFDRVYSFGALHWTDLGASFKNIEMLLTPGGECLLVYPVSTPSLDWWARIAQKEPWTKYAKVVEAMLPNRLDTSDRDAALDHISGMLDAAKLKQRSCEMAWAVPMVVRDIDHLIDAVLTVNPLRDLLSQEENKVLEEDMAHLIRSDTSAEMTSGSITYPFDMISIHASKRHA